MTIYRTDIPKENKGFAFINRMTKDPLNFFVTLAENTGSHTWFRMPGQNVLFLNDASGIRHVMHKNYKNYWKGKYNQVLKPIFGKGIFLAEGDDWKTQRKQLAPSLSAKHFQHFTQSMINSAELMFKRLDENVKNDTNVDLFMEMMWYTIDVVLRALYQSDNENSADQIKDSLAVLLVEAEKRIWSFFSLPQNWVLNVPPYRGAKNILLDIVKALIEAKEQSKDHPEDFLATCIETYGKDPKTRDILFDQVMSFLLAGHETTANGLIWTFYELAKRPDLQQDIRKEMNTVLADGTITFSNIKKMKVAKGILNESLRMYPPVWSISRASYNEDLIPLDNGDQIQIPAKTIVMMCTYAVHRNTTYWDDPEAFVPERFNEDNTITPFSFFPFGGGARTCVGQQFAEVESLIMMCLFLQRYDFSLVPGQKIEKIPAITLKPNGPVYFKLRKRKG